MILVDSSVWIHYFNGRVMPQTDWLDAALGQTPLLIGDLILTEVLQGFYRDSDYKKAKQLLGLVPLVILGSKTIAIKSAENYRYLRKKGVTVRKTIDVIIGSYCIHNKIALLHDDKDFESIAKHLKLQTVDVLK